MGKFTKYVEIQADTGDADYVTVIREISDVYIEDFTPLLKAIKENKTKENFPIRDFGYIEEMYPDFDEEVLDNFCYFVPKNTHTICSVEIYKKTDEHKLF